MATLFQEPLNASYSAHYKTYETRATWRTDCGIQANFGRKEPLNTLEHLGAQFNQFDMFKSIKSINDGLDELVGAILIPFYCLYRCIESCVLAVISLKSIRLGNPFGVIHCGLELNNAMNFLILGLSCFLKSSVSLVTRPVVTMASAFFKPSTPEPEGLLLVDESIEFTA